MAGLHREVYLEARPPVNLVVVGLRRRAAQHDGHPHGECDRRRPATADRRVAGALRARDDAGSQDRPIGDERRAALVLDAVPLQRASGDGAIRGRRCRRVVGRVADPIPGDRRTGRSRRGGRRGPSAVGRVSQRRGPRSSAAGERPADLDLRGEPPRPSSRPGQGRHRRRHARRPARHAASQHHRRALLALSERSALSRPLRRARDVRRRRGQHREPRVQHQPVPRRQVSVDVVVTWGPDGGA